MSKAPHKKLTTAAGAPVAHNQQSLTAGERGSMLMEDVWLFEKLGHLNREVIPERRMHAKGYGAHGVFRTTADITRYTKADLFAEVGRETPVFVRFSTVAGERGAADAERDIRGFAVKFYTRQGNWDLVGNNTPVFFLRDPRQFADLNHAIKRHPASGLSSPAAKWDFWTSLPEAFHQVTITMSERGIPDGFRHMHGFGSHTFSLVNAANERVWVKFHWICQQGIRNLTDEQAAAIIAQDRDSAGRDLYQAIERGDFPRWKLCIQVMTDAQAQRFRFNPFDLTKVWPHADYPLIEVGEMELNRNPENYYAEVEQSAFNPAQIVPGIGFSPDKMLQGRLFAYGDAQRYRLGVNHHQIPINKPLAGCPLHSFHRDGQMRVDGNAGDTTTYAPNSMGEWQEQAQFTPPPAPVSGEGDFYSFAETEEDYYAQPRQLFLLMTPDQRQALFDNTARALAGVPEFICRRHLEHCYACHPDYGKGIQQALFPK